MRSLVTVLGLICSLPLTMERYRNKCIEDQTGHAIPPGRRPWMQQTYLFEAIPVGPRQIARRVLIVGEL